MKKLLALLLALVMVFSLVACGNTGKETTKETGKESSTEESKDDSKEDTKEETKGNETGETPVLKYTFIGKGTDTEKVQEKINARLDELKAGYHIELAPIDWGEYDQKLGLAARGAGDPFDIATVASWLGPYQTLANDQALLDLEELLPKAAPKIAEKLTEEQLKGARTLGKLYAIPTTTTGIVARDWFIFNATVAKELGYTPEKLAELDTVEKLEPILKAYKEKYPNKFPLDPESEWAIRRVDSLIRTNEDGTGQAENIFTNDAMKKSLDTIKTYAEAGYINPEAGAENTPKQEGKDDWLVRRSEGEPGAEALWAPSWKEKGVEIKAILEATDKFVDNSKIQGKMTAVYAHTKYPEQAVNFIELIGTDEVIQNLLGWGIEGEHYEVKDGRAFPLEGKDDKWSAWGNQFVRTELRIPGELDPKVDDPAFKEEQKMFAESLVPAFDLGFTPSEEAARMLGEVQAVKNNHYKFLARGQMDSYETFLSELEAAGINELVEMLNTELKEWKGQ